MNKSVLETKPYRLLAGKRFKIVILILVLQILFTGPLGMDVYSWGAFRGIARFAKVTETHQDIIRAAYGLLMRDPVMSRARLMFLGDNSFLNADDILQYEGIDVIPDVSSGLYTTFGPGPDADGSAPFSWHWYNPRTFSGYAPRAASNHYIDFALATLQTTFDRERALKGMAWSAHFVADMTVPYHVNGVPYFNENPKLEPGPCILSEEDSGPLYLCNLTPSLLLPSSQANKEQYWGYGLNKDFTRSFETFKKVRENASLMDDGVNPIDWFDPWYWNGSIISDARSSHATFEANAHIAWLEKGGLLNPIFSGTGQYDKLWENGLPDYEFSGNAAGIQSEQVWRFASRVADRTRENSQYLFLSPADGIIEAVFGVYTVWRSAWSALQPVIDIEPDITDPGKIIIRTSAYNHAQEACQNVKIRLTIMDGSAIYFQNSIPLTDNLPGTVAASIDWNVPIERNKNYTIFTEVVGAYSKTPDLQYAYCSNVYESDSEPQTEEQEVFGDNRWIQNAFTGDIYYLPEGTSQLPDFSALNSVGKIYAKILNIPERPFDTGFPNVTSRFEWFAIRYTGDIRIRSSQEGEYTFKLTSDDGSRLIIDNKIIINNDGQHPTSAGEGSIFLTEGIHQVTIEYFQGPRLYVALIFEVRPPGAWSFSPFNKDDY
jgi:hypothetical protein